MAQITCTVRATASHDEPLQQVRELMCSLAEGAVSAVYKKPEPLREWEVDAVWESTEVEVPDLRRTVIQWRMAFAADGVTITSNLEELIPNQMSEARLHTSRTPLPPEIESNLVFGM